MTNETPFLDPLIKAENFQMWPDDARGTLLQAVCGAFNKVTIPTRRNVHITSEPEACTLYVIQDVIRKNSRSLQIVS
jgi:hypothetical protein